MQAEGPAVLDGFNLHPSSIDGLAIPIVAGALALYLLLRGQSTRTSRVLAAMFACAALFGLTGSLITAWRGLVFAYLQLFFALPTAWLLLGFAYLFQGNAHPQEARWALGVSGGMMVALLAHVAYRLFTDDPLRPYSPVPHQLFALGLVLYTLGVFVRKARLPGARGHSHRALALLFLLIGAGVLCGLLGALGWITKPLAVLLFNLCILLFIAGFGFVFIYYTQQPISFQAQVVGLSFLTVVTILAAIGRSTTSEAEVAEALARRLPAATALHVRPDAQGTAYRALDHPFDDDTLRGRPLPLADGVEAVLALATPFPFAGQQWDTLYVNRNGLVAFGGSFRPVRLDDFYDPQPKIAPLHLLLRPGDGGGVFVHQSPEQVTLTWHRMQQPGTDHRVDVQLLLYPDGSFTFQYPMVEAAIRRGARGVHTGAERPRWDALLAPLPSRGAQAMLVEDFTHQFNRRVHRRLAPLFYGLLGAAAFLLFVFPLLFRASLIRPMDRLLAGMERVNQGRLDQTVPVGARDEVGRLTEQFNQMTASLKAANDELQQYTEQLEEKVAARTAQITQQNERLAAQAEQLRTLDAAKSRFFANISHEFRTPLTLILCPLEQSFCPGVVLSPEDRHLMLRNGQRLQRLIDQILDLARLEAGSLTLDLQPHDLDAFLRQQVGLFQSAATYRSQTLTYEPAEDPCWVRMDPAHLEKVVGNLLSNALKFTQAGGRVAVTCTPTAGEILFTVVDTGAGIPADALPHLFDRFYQVDDASTRTQEGSGIGLALVQELTTLHGGTVAVQSKVGTGTTFTVCLPRLEVPAVAPPPSAPAPAAFLASPLARPTARMPRQDGTGAEEAAADRTTVLVVEDNADLRQFLAGLLREDFRVLEAADGQAGLEAAQAALPDLILADVMMPRLDGIGLSRALKGAPETDTIPLVLLTARAGTEDAVEGLETGADAYLTKPFQPEALRLQVRNLIARQHRLRDRLTTGTLPLPAPPPAQPQLSDFVQQVEAVVRARMADPLLSVEDVAAAVGLDRFRLYRQLKAEADTTPRQLITTMRLETAAALLRTDAGTISEVAYGVGFNSLSYFSQCFRARFGVAPSAYRA